MHVFYVVIIEDDESAGAADWSGARPVAVAQSPSGSAPAPLPVLRQVAVAAHDVLESVAVAETVRRCTGCISAEIVGLRIARGR